MDSLLSVADEYHGESPSPVITPVQKHSTTNISTSASRQRMIVTQQPSLNNWNSAASIDHIHQEIKRISDTLQLQIDALATKMTESRLNEQRARYRDRELIMQALQKQKDDNVAFTKQVIFTKTTDHSDEIKREEMLLQKIQVSVIFLRICLLLNWFVFLYRFVSVFTSFLFLLCFVNDIVVCMSTTLCDF